MGADAGTHGPFAHEAAPARLPDDVRAYVGWALVPGERLLWARQPDPSVRFTRVDAFLVFERPDPWTWPFGHHKALCANTGMDLLFRRGMGVAFYDVADGGGLVAAMGQRWS